MGTPDNTAIADLLCILANTVPDRVARTFSHSVLSDVCSDIERRGQIVRYLLVPLEVQEHLGASIWGTPVLYSEEVPSGTGYAIGDDGYSVCFRWETLPEPPEEPVLSEEIAPAELSPVEYLCPHCGKKILVTLLKVAS